MTKEEVLKLAVEAGAYFEDDSYILPEHCFEVFAKLVEAKLLNKEK